MACKTGHTYSVSSPAIQVETLEELGILEDVADNDTFKKQFDGEKECSAIEGPKKNRMKSCFAPCIAISKYSWKTYGAVFLVLAVILITIEMAADTNFCYFTAVVPLDIIPMSTPRGTIYYDVSTH